MLEGSEGKISDSASRFGGAERRLPHRGFESRRVVTDCIYNEVYFSCSAKFNLSDTQPSAEEGPFRSSVLL